MNLTLVEEGVGYRRQLWGFRALSWGTGLSNNMGAGWTCREASWGLALLDLTEIPDRTQLPARSHF